MPRLQKVTEKVFAEIAETPQKKGAYTTFLDIDSVLDLPESAELHGLKSLYKELVTESKDVISTLAALEEIIIQIRCKNRINEELRLSLSRNYIYARSIFYRRGNQINDIRIVVGTTESFGDDLNSLIEDLGFRGVCITKLQKAMDKEIKGNINHLNTLLKNEKIKSN
jgi:hypothetical protein